MPCAWWCRFQAGFFEARELKDVGFEPLALKKLGYTPKDMWEAEIPAKAMRAIECMPRAHTLTRGTLH